MSMSAEDEKMFLNQVVCGSCFHRFTTIEDCQIHIMFVHEKQPTAHDIMEMLEQILVTVSRENNNGTKEVKSKPDDRTSPPQTIL